MRTNVLLITADDMNYDSPGFAGCRVPDITPNLDRLASESLYLHRAHVTAAICQPSRQALMTGRFPHNSGAPGFDPIDPSVPTLQEQLHKGGYLNGILSKVNGLAPRTKFCWDFVREVEELGRGRVPSLYHQATAEFLARSKAQGEPFFLMANSNDPHRPFAGSQQEKEHERRLGPYPPVRRTYTPAEAQVPGFLPDLPDVRREAAEYFASVHRCDETVGAVLKALKESGLEDRTLVVFLSDNGMAFPFAKTNCYLASTRTPWLVRWPGKVRPGTTDREHFINGIDFAPTILEACGLPPLAGIDGRSFLPVLAGEKQDGRESVLTVINTIASKKAYPMRAIQTRRFGYLYNSWSDGVTVFKNESQSGLSFRAMQAAAETDPRVADRVRLFQYRVVEELYDFEKDPCALTNLAGDPAYGDELRRLRRAMGAALTAARDPLADPFRRQVMAE